MFADEPALWSTHPQHRHQWVCTRLPRYRILEECTAGALFLQYRVNAGCKMHWLEMSSSEPSLSSSLAIA